LQRSIGETGFYKLMGKVYANKLYPKGAQISNLTVCYMVLKQYPNIVILYSITDGIILQHPTVLYSILWDYNIQCL